jgi:hypothetical protein
LWIVIYDDQLLMVLRGVQWGLFDRHFKVKQLLQPSPNLDDFFVAALSKRATAMMSYR